VLLNIDSGKSPARTASSRRCAVARLRLTMLAPKVETQRLGRRPARGLLAAGRPEARDGTCALLVVSGDELMWR